MDLFRLAIISSSGITIVSPTITIKDNASDFVDSSSSADILAAPMCT